MIIKELKSEIITTPTTKGIITIPKLLSPVFFKIEYRIKLENIENVKEDEDGNLLVEVRFKYPTKLDIDIFSYIRDRIIEVSDEIKKLIEDYLNYDRFLRIDIFGKEFCVEYDRNSLKADLTINKNLLFSYNLLEDMEFNIIYNNSIIQMPGDPVKLRFVKLDKFIESKNNDSVRLTFISSLI